MTIRPATHQDTDRIGEIAEAAGLFPADMTKDMVEPALAGGQEVWLVAEHDGTVAGFSFSRPEEMTDRTWNMLALGVDPSAQGHGIGTALLAATENALPDARMIIIETTQLPEQEAARALYTAQGYAQHGHIPDFYGNGEDKIIFSKRLAEAA